MNKYKKYLGMVVDGMIIEDIVQYFDLSSEKVEYGFVVSERKIGYVINCSLFINRFAA